MTIGPERLVAELKAQGLPAEGPLKFGGHLFVVVSEFLVLAGRFAGQRIRIAAPAPADFPSTPPGGLYISPCLVPVGTLGVHDRQNETGDLPGQWQYWSRPIPPGTWRPDRSGKRLIAHWNAVLANVQ
jgi:hypothetical protein